MKYLPAILLVSIATACAPKPEGTEALVEEAPSQLTEETVRVVGQMRPAAEPQEFDMPILKGHEAWEMVPPGESDIQSDELVLGMFLGDDTVAMPIRHMSGFEVSNLDVNGTSYLITWCPLVGSARLFDGKMNGKDADFDFGMGLVDNNLLIVARETNTPFGQLSCKSIGGDTDATDLQPLPSIQTTWAYWQNMNPNSKVLINTDTSGAVFPQFVNETVLYTRSIPDPNGKYEPNMEHQLDHLGLGISSDQGAVFYRLDSLLNNDLPVKTTFGGQDILIFGNAEGMTAWAETVEGELLPGTMVYQWAWMNFYPESEVR